MILFLSTAFLRRLKMQWKTGMKGFLIGERNMFFFYPDFFLESPEITPQTIDHFLRSNGSERASLLGFLAPEEITFLPGYAELTTGDVWNPQEWTARVHLLGDTGAEYKKLDLKIAESGTE